METASDHNLTSSPISGSMAVSAKDGADGSTAGTRNVSDAGHEEDKLRVNSNEERERREVGGSEHW